MNTSSGYLSKPKKTGEPSQSLEVLLPSVPVVPIARKALTDPALWAWTGSVILVMCSLLMILGLISRNHQENEVVKVDMMANREVVRVEAAETRAVMQKAINHTQELRDEIVRLKAVIAEKGK